MANNVHSVIDTEHAVQIIDTANITVFINDLEPVHISADKIPEALDALIANTTPTSYLVLKVTLFIEHDTDLDDDGNTMDVDKITLKVVTWDGVCTCEWVTKIDPETGESLGHDITEGSML